MIYVRKAGATIYIELSEIKISTGIETAMDLSNKLNAVFPSCRFCGKHALINIDNLCSACAELREGV